MACTELVRHVQSVRPQHSDHSQVRLQHHTSALVCLDSLTTSITQQHTPNTLGCEWGAFLLRTTSWVLCEVKSIHPHWTTQNGTWYIPQRYTIRPAHPLQDALHLFGEINQQYCRLRARRALSQFSDIPLRTRRVLLLYKVYGIRLSTLLVLNRTLLNSVKATR